MSKRKTGSKRAQTRALILEVAATQFARLGYSGVSMGVLSRESGFTKGALYDHFDGKGDLYTQCVSSYVKRELDAVIAESHVSHTGCPRERLLIFMRHFLERLCGDIVFRRLLQRLLIDSEPLDMTAVTEDSLLSPFRYVVELLEAYRPDIDAKNQIYAFFCSAILGEDLRAVAEILSPESTPMPTTESLLAHFRQCIDSGAGDQMGR